MNRYLQIPDETIDLHGYTTDEARIALDNLFKNNTSSHVRIIVGKGIHSEMHPVLRNFVKRYLAMRNIRFNQSKIQDGGEGALEVSFMGQGVKF